jgi:hypothetical protein
VRLVQEEIALYDQSLIDMKLQFWNQVAAFTNFEGSASDIPPIKAPSSTWKHKFIDPPYDITIHNYGYPSNTRIINHPASTIP